MLLAESRRRRERFRGVASDGKQISVPPEHLHGPLPPPSSFGLSISSQTSVLSRRAHLHSHPMPVPVPIPTISTQAISPTPISVDLTASALSPPTNSLTPMQPSVGIDLMDAKTALR